ncbi:MAG: 2-polyprenyl-6-hydroxyphenyl methylase / 3-demethylubiquinone-9 3-methyltransferase [Actinomycetota bacterium]|jgi:ubiquinone/menaquinone biosynthesis C-methylase UbiE
MKRGLKLCVPAALLMIVGRPASPARIRVGAFSLLLALWSFVYARYRATARAVTAHERELLRTANWETYSRHYNEQVPTIEEEFDIWGAYHQHRHEMRYDKLAGAATAACPDGGVVLDVGCGSALVADRLAARDATYIGVDYGGHHITYARSKHAAERKALRTEFARCNAETLPFADGKFDVVVLSEVIEHLMRPERAVWEIARVLKPGGVVVMTTNNASEMPLWSPLTHLFAWLEKAFGAYHPSLISRRPWVWPHKMDRSILPADAPDVWLPHTHHIYAETRAMFAAAGLDAFEFSTFEFPPPQAKLSAWLDGRGEPGRRAVDALEAVCERVPLVNRLGCHLFVLARKNRAPATALPPAGVWPGPFSHDGADVAASASPTASAT